MRILATSVCSLLQKCLPCQPLPVPNSHNSIMFSLDAFQTDSYQHSPEQPPENDEVTSSLTAEEKTKQHYDSSEKEERLSQPGLESILKPPHNCCRDSKGTDPTCVSSAVSESNDLYSRLVKLTIPSKKFELVNEQALKRSMLTENSQPPACAGSHLPRYRLSLSLTGEVTNDPSPDVMLWEVMPAQGYGTSSDVARSTQIDPVVEMDANDEKSSGSPTDEDGSSYLAGQSSNRKEENGESWFVDAGAADCNNDIDLSQFEKFFPELMEKVQNVTTTSFLGNECDSCF